MLGDRDLHSPLPLTLPGPIEPTDHSGTVDGAQPQQAALSGKPPAATVLCQKKTLFPTHGGVSVAAPLPFKSWRILAKEILAKSLHLPGLWFLHL